MTAKTRFRGLRPFQVFARTGSLSGILLLVSTVVALTWANSPWHESYFALLERRFAVGPAEHPLELSLLAWCNDALMALFFLLVGLEIKRELMVGELASPRRAALPIAAAIGGMVVPALVYWAINPSGAASAGWGIPMATDIAFALGILALLGPRVPLGLKVFLTALAIVDDMGAVIVIALFYTGAVHTGALLVAGAALAVLVLLNSAGVRRLAPYLVVGLVLWIAVHEAGVHSTVAGVLLALAIPSNTRINAAEFSARARGLITEFDQAETGDLLVITSKGQQEAIHALEVTSEGVQAPLLRLEHSLQGVVQYGIMPLFAFANAGVRLTGAESTLIPPVALGVAAGLVVGKPLGILSFSWLAVRLGVATLPAESSWRLVVGAACLGGIGFTMSLFIAALAFDEASLLASAKLGIIAASTAAGAIGAAVLWRGLAAGPR
jgi:NhaA family Na+:H+ antiporter